MPLSRLHHQFSRFIPMFSWLNPNDSWFNPPFSIFAGEWHRFLETFISAQAMSAHVGPYSWWTRETTVKQKNVDSGMLINPLQNYKWINSPNCRWYPFLNSRLGCVANNFIDVTKQRRKRIHSALLWRWPRFNIMATPARAFLNSQGSYFHHRFLGVTGETIRHFDLRVGSCLLEFNQDPRGAPFGVHFISISSPFLKA